MTRVTYRDPQQWIPVGHMPPENEDMRRAAYNLSDTLAKLMFDPTTTLDTKAAISEWFNNAMPIAPPKVTDGMIVEALKTFGVRATKGSVEDMGNALRAALKVSYPNGPELGGTEPGPEPKPVPRSTPVSGFMNGVPYDNTGRPIQEGDYIAMTPEHGVTFAQVVTYANGSWGLAGLEIYLSELDFTQVRVLHTEEHPTTTHLYLPMTEGMRPQDEFMDGRDWKFEPLEHGGEYPDSMPQAIRGTDRLGRACMYFPATAYGKVVDSKGFVMKPATVLGPEPQLCQDEGCDHHGTKHVCVTPEPAAPAPRKGRTDWPAIHDMETLEVLSRPLMHWLAKNYHPHTRVVIDSCTAELLEGLCTVKTYDYVEKKS